MFESIGTTTDSTDAFCLTLIFKKIYNTLCKENVIVIIEWFVVPVKLLYYGKFLCVNNI